MVKYRNIIVKKENLYNKTEVLEQSQLP